MISRNIFNPKFIITSLILAVIASTYLFYSYIDVNKSSIQYSVGKINYDAFNIAEKVKLAAAQAKREEAEKLALKLELEEKALEVRVVKHITKVNHKVENKVAYDLAQAVINESKRQGIPLEILLAIIKVESHFDKDAVGTSGEISYFQVMPEMHKDKVQKLKREKVITTTNLKNVKTNSAVGAKILRSCFDRYTEIEMKLACYNGSQKDIKKTYATKVLKQVALTKL